MNYLKIFRAAVIVGGLLLWFYSGPISVLAAPTFTASPLLIDYKTSSRDILTKDITLTNTSDRQIRLYASVHEISVDDDGIKEFVSPSMTDRSVSITSWIAVSQARLELPAGGTLTVPLTIRVHPNTPPGEYQALIGFASGRNRDDIEAKVLKGDAANVIVKITITDETEERLQVVQFTTSRVIFKDPAGDLSVLLANTGDVPVTPDGEVVIYDTTGKELSAVPVNQDNVTIMPGERKLITAPLPFLSDVGRHKAQLSLSYGKNQASVIDTAFYYSLPWYYLLGMFLVLFGLLGVITWLFRRTLRDQTDAADAYDLPVYVSSDRSHKEFDHDINLKRDTTDQ